MMATQLTREQIQSVIDFHGHMCPGIAIGLRVSEVALRELGGRAADEELVAVVETDGCAVDAVQVLVGCTFGKGNLLHQDHGQSRFTFSRRSDARTIRVEGLRYRGREMSVAEQELVDRVRAGEGTDQDGDRFAALWEERCNAVLAADEEDVLKFEAVPGYVIPDKASLHPSVICAACAVPTMATRIAELDGLLLCPSCYQIALQDRVVARVIGVVHNELVPGKSAPQDRSPESSIVLASSYAEGLEGVAAFSHLQVLFAFDGRPTTHLLRQHPRGDSALPERGVFALRSPHRPSPIGLTTVRLLRVEGAVLVVSNLDCWDGTRVIDIKPWHGDDDEAG